VGWLTGWTYRRKITLDVAAATLTNFPALVHVAVGDGIALSEMRSDGHDIRFTDSDGETLLGFEREDFGGDPYIVGDWWVKVPSIGTSTGPEIYMYWGKADAADASSGTAPWDASFMLVAHMSGFGTSTTPDSLGAHTLTKKASTQPDEVEGIASGPAQQFDNVDDYIYTHIAPPAGAMTWECMTYDATASTGILHFNGVGPPSVANSQDRSLGINSSGRAGVYVYNGGYVYATGTSDIRGTNWHHLAGRIHATNGLSVVVDGVAEATNGSGTDAWNGNGDPRFYMGAGCTPDNGGFITYGGDTLDEVRLSSVARSDAWLSYTTHNALDADHGLTWSAKETAGGEPPAGGGDIHRAAAWRRRRG
jgi:hypothetical protein